jgi:hypothetical protein
MKQEIADKRVAVTKTVWEKLSKEKRAGETLGETVARLHEDHDKYLILVAAIESVGDE